MFEPAPSAEELAKVYAWAHAWATSRAFPDTMEAAAHLRRHFGAIGAEEYAASLRRIAAEKAEREKAREAAPQAPAGARSATPPAKAQQQTLL